MKINGKIKSILVGITIMSFAFGGCTKYASDDDLQALNNQRQAALSAEQKVEQLERDKADLERQVTEKERELSQAQSVLAEVRRGNNN